MQMSTNWLGIAAGGSGGESKRPPALAWQSALIAVFARRSDRRLVLFVGAFFTKPSDLSQLAPQEAARLFIQAQMKNTTEGAANEEARAENSICHLH